MLFKKGRLNLNLSPQLSNVYFQSGAVCTHCVVATSINEPFAKVCFHNLKISEFESALTRLQNRSYKAQQRAIGQTVPWHHHLVNSSCNAVKRKQPWRVVSVLVIFAVLVPHVLTAILVDLLFRLWGSWNQRLSKFSTMNRLRGNHFLMCSKYEAT